MTEASRGVGRVRVLSPRTRRTYAADWGLFTDWCAATDVVPPPMWCRHRCGAVAGGVPAVRAAVGRPANRGQPGPDDHLDPLHPDEQPTPIHDVGERTSA